MCLYCVKPYVYFFQKSTNVCSTTTVSSYVSTKSVVTLAPVRKDSHWLATWYHVNVSRRLLLRHLHAIVTEIPQNMYTIFQPKTYTHPNSKYKNGGLLDYKFLLYTKSECYLKTDTEPKKCNRQFSIPWYRKLTLGRYRAFYTSHCGRPIQSGTISIYVGSIQPCRNYYAKTKRCTLVSELYLR